MQKQLLVQRNKIGTYRSLKQTENLIDFASNDYLGLAQSETLRDAIHSQWKNYNIGASGSRLLTGNNECVETLEEEIAQFHGFEAGLIFNCGYMANLGLFESLAGKDDIYLFDTEIHASIREGIRRSQAKAYPFRHNNLTHLESRLKTCCSTNTVYICIESLYSTDGSIAPLRDVCSLAERYGAHVIVDEAHAVGIYGPSGKGLVFEANLQDKIFAQTITFGKALGCFGAMVLGNSILRSFLINFAKPFIYTTALPFPCLIAIRETYKVFPYLHEKRNHLQDLIHIGKLSESPIQPLYVHDNQEAHALSKHLESEGFDVRPLLSPTVQRGKELLRITLHAHNTREQLETLLHLIRSFYE